VDALVPSSVRDLGRVPNRYDLLLFAALLLAVGGIVVAATRPAPPVPWDPALAIPDPPPRRSPDGYLIGDLRPEGIDQQLRLRVMVSDDDLRPDGEGTVRFTVRLTNPTPNDIALDPCPFYRMGIFADDIGDAAYYRLNCARAAKVPAHGHVDFDMEAATTDFQLCRRLDPPCKLDAVWQLWGPG
jgi:hypothetical protein